MASSYFKEWLVAATNPRQILLVEDEDNDASLIQRGSEDFNIRWTIARSYRDALFCLEDPNAKFRLVVLDLHLRSQPDGAEVFKTIKEKWPWLPVLVLSGHLSDAVIDSLTKHGFVMFLKKPTSFDLKFFGELFFVLNIPKKPEKAILEEKQQAYNI